MAQSVLPFKYESEKKTTGMTALAGLPVYLDLARVAGLSKSIEKHLKVRKGGQGWTDSQIGVIEFAIGCNVTRKFKQAVAKVEESEWKPIYKTAFGKKYKTGVELLINARKRIAMLQPAPSG